MRKEIKIGLMGIVAIGLFIFGLNYLRGISMLESSRSYYVNFTNINGLPTSSPVFANGYKIGIVRDIQYNYKELGSVTVKIELDEEMRIPMGSKGELVTEMLGTVKMNLILNLESQSYLQPGDTLDGFANNGLMGVAETMVPKVEQLLPKMDSILSSLNRLLADPALTQTLHNAEQITANLNVTTHELNKLMKNELPTITGNLTSISENINTITTNLKEVDYASTMKRIDSTLANIQTLTNKLNSKDNTIGLLFNDPTLYQNLSATTANASSLLEDLKAHPKRYVHFSIFGKKDKLQSNTK
jgi:phospholipid/cholesterol/gamma-HCH transport system substrate-binding protein